MREGHFLFNFRNNIPYKTRLPTMNFIVYDLEATCWQGDALGKRSEVIEIGALRFNGYGELTGEYNRFIKPKLNPILSAYCKELTSISQDQIDRAKSFDIVLDQFHNWCGDFEDKDFKLFSWGKFDPEMLINDCKLHDLDSYWIEGSIDIKRQYKELKRLSKQVGLDKALRMEGREFEGTRHRAFDDAENTAHIFLEYRDEWVY